MKMKQILIMSRVELKNYMGFNVIRHSKDPSEKKRMIALFLVIAFVAVMFLGYMCGVSILLIGMGAGKVVPTMMIFLASALVFAMESLKVSGSIFRNNGYQMIASMPISTSSIVIGRFVRLYVDGFSEGCLFMVPGFVIYALMESPGAMFYICGFLTLFLVPILPLSLSIFVGTLITRITNRMKHKSIWEAILSIGFVFGTFGWLAGKGQTVNFTIEEVTNSMVQSIERFGKVYPPARQMGEGMVEGNPAAICLTGGLFFGIFLCVMAVTIKGFHGICRILQAGGTTRSHMKNLSLEKVGQKGVFESMVRRDFKRYLASGNYISNTIMGPVMAVAAATAVLFTDTTKLTAGVPIQINLQAALPIVIGALMGMMNPTSTTISLEGKEWWILKSLPVSNKMILDSKLVFNLLLDLPFFVIIQILLGLGNRGDLAKILWSVVLMGAVVTFSCIFSLTMNLKVPKMEWDNEVIVIKQSASAGLSMLGMLPCIFLGMIAMVTPSLWLVPVRIITCVVLGGTAALLYRYNVRQDLRKI